MGLYLYLVLTRLLVGHDYNIYYSNLTPWRHVCLVSIINSSPSLYSIHVIMHSRMLSTFTRGTVLLLNDDALPTADASNECFEKNLLPNGALLPNSAHMSVSSLYQFLVLTYPCHVAIFSPFLILPSRSLTLVSLYLSIPIQNDEALGSSIPTVASSCGGERREKLRRAPVMEHAKRYSTKARVAEPERLV
jgi:hypothetical protein